MYRRRSHNDSVRQQNSRNLRLVRLLISLILIIGAFALGFVLRGNDAVLTRLGFSVISQEAQQNPALTLSGNTYDSLSARIAEVEGILKKDSLDSYDLDSTTNSMLAVFTHATDDPYLRYYDASHYANYLKEMSATYSGVGILFAERDGAAYVLDVFNGSQAQALGVRSGDYVVAINGDRGNAGWTLAETVKAVTGEEGTSVVLTLRRPEAPHADGGSEFTVTLQCSNYHAPNVITELSNGVGYIKLSQVTQNAEALVSQAVKELNDQGAQSFVLDIRDNPGGYLTQAVDVTSLFQRSGKVVTIRTKEGETTRDASGNQITTAPMVVIVNGNTAGTAEVMAGALKDSDRATIIGETTMGRGCVQSVRELTFGGALRYTSAYYFTPKGYAINDVGIAPNIVVNADDNSDVDSQKKFALELARSQAAL